jgi:hypothetical protein
MYARRRIGGLRLPSRLRPRITYANVVSTLALAVALGGGTAVALDKINAGSVDGVSAARISFARPITIGPTAKFKTMFKHAGLVLQARCVQQSGFFMDAHAKSRVNNAEINADMTDNLNDHTHVFDRDFDRNQPLELPLSGDQGSGTLTYTTAKGGQVSIVLHADTGSVLGNKKACLIGGHALYSTPH